LLAALGARDGLLWPGSILYGALGVAAGLVLTSVAQRARSHALALADRQVLEGSKRWTGERRQRGRNAYRLAAELNSTLDFDQVIELALDLSGRSMAETGGEEDRLTRAVLLTRNGHLSVASGRRLSQAERRETVAVEGSLLAEVLAAGEPRLTHEPMTDPALHRLHSLRNARAVLCVPVASGLVEHGVMVFAHPRDDFFTPERVDTLQAISQQTAIALQNAKLYRDLAEEKQRFTEIQEEARKKLARDLHDGPTQALATIAMRVNFARRLLDKDRKAAVEELGKVEDLARQTTKDVRHMLFTLRPLILESQGLVAALQQLGQKVGDTHRQKVILEAEPDVADELELPRQAVIFYIAEEAINNARKHARAEHIWVRLAVHGDQFVLEVQDDGVGFNVGAVDASYAQRGSLGMVNMRERTRMIRGQLRVESAEGKGTRIILTVPVQDLTSQAEAEEQAPRPADSV
jgi:signal transduction histidine kinase